MAKFLNTAAAVSALAMAACATGANAQSMLSDGSSGRLLLTGGVTQIEGAGGAGLAPWALITGYETEDQIGGSAFVTDVKVDDFELLTYGAAVGLFNRVELSVAKQEFDLEDVGAALSLGRGFTIEQVTYGAKVRLFGDAVLEQDSWIPQVAVGVQYKDNEQDALVRSLGAEDGDGIDYYVAATKIFLDQSLLVNGTVRYTKANQYGILGFGSATEDYSAQFEGSVAYLLSRNLAIGAEYRTKPDNLGVAEEESALDAFIAWAPTKNIATTLAYVDLGNIVVGEQKGYLLSVQFAF